MPVLHSEADYKELETECLEMSFQMDDLTEENVRLKHRLELAVRELERYKALARRMLGREEQE